MCGVIVVDAGKSRSTNLGRDAYILIISLNIVVIIWSSINFPRVICLPTVCYFLERNHYSNIRPPGQSFIILLCDLFLFAFVFRSIISKTQKYLAALFYTCLFRVIARSIYPNHTNQSIFCPKRDWQPLLHVGLQVFILCVQVPFT